MSASEEGTRHAWRGRRRTVALVLVVFLALIALQSARMGAAGAFVHLAEAEIAGWQTSARPVGLEQTSRVAAQLAASLRIAAHNPWALEKLGALKLAVLRSHRDPAVALAETRDALDRFRAALRERPASAYLWANLARAKLHLDEVDAELLTAMRHADRLGPWEPVVQETLLFVGLAVWSELDGELQEARVRSIQRSAARNAQKTFAIVKLFRRYDLVCGLDEYNSVAERDCRQARETARKVRSGPGR